MPTFVQYHVPVFTIYYNVYQKELDFLLMNFSDLVILVFASLVINLKFNHRQDFLVFINFNHVVLRY